jgi:sialic acid synthase SpsE
MDRSVQPPLVIAEIGINHGGNLTIAKEMVDAAFRSGVEVVKHQTHIVEDEMSVEALQVIPGNSKKSIFEIMDSCALNEEDEFELKKYVETLRIPFHILPKYQQKQKVPPHVGQIDGGFWFSFPLFSIRKIHLLG